MRLFNGIILATLVALCSVSTSMASSMDNCVSKGNRTTEVCDDAIFLRRTYLLLTGELPPIEVVTKFLDNSSPKRRSELIEELLESNGYSRYMQMRWGDILRIKSEFPSNLWPNGVQAYNQWLYRHLLNNTPYDVMVRDLLISTGSNFKSPAVNFYRAFLERTPKTIYENINLLFLGQRSCSDNGYECFSQLRYKSTKEWKEEIIYLDVNGNTQLPKVTLADGTKLKFPEKGDWRIAYVDWLTSQRQFASVMVNRLWFWIFGRGLVDEPDDWRADNPAKESKLLNHLTDYFIKSGYDTKKLMSYILNSQTYQGVAKQGSLFEPRRLPAEVIVDAIADVTDFSETYQSRVPEPFTFYPPKTRSRDLGDATVSSSALELFGKVSRDVSLESQRNNSITSRQLLYLMNSSELEGRIKRSPLVKSLMPESVSDEEMIQRAMIAVLSRPATEAEVKIFTENFAKRKLKRGAAVADVIWVLMNSNEFLYIY